MNHYISFERLLVPKLEAKHTFRYHHNLICEIGIKNSNVDKQANEDEALFKIVKGLIETGEYFLPFKLFGGLKEDYKKGIGYTQTPTKLSHNTALLKLLTMLHSAVTTSTKTATATGIYHQLTSYHN